MTRATRLHPPLPASQKGVTTLVVTLILLGIVTIMALFATSVGFFEQKTATNENRSRLSQHAAEYALNLAGEYLKANRDKLISNVTSENGWLA
ncbi:MAG: PilX N-terminal domain-containing pilus assembly protein, partial [Gemmatimonadaceae bacterium]